MMKRENIFKGLGVALVTPFEENGEIDFFALRSLVESIIRDGADFLCVLGTTAETPCLSTQEKAEVMKAVVEVSARRIPLLLGCGGNNTAEVVRYLKQTDLSAFSGVLIVAPYYNKPSQEGLYQHFKCVSEASPLPVVLYNVPGRTGANMQPETTLRIAKECPNVVAIKEASGNLAQIEEVISHAPEGFEVLSGDDAITQELLAMGAVGVISVIGNACPAAFGEMVHKALEEDFNASMRIHQQFRRLYKLMTVDGNPAGVKALLALQGKIANRLRLPLVPACAVTQEKIGSWLSWAKNTLYK